MRYLFIVLIVFLSNPLLAQNDTLVNVGLGISIDPTNTEQLIYLRTSLQNVDVIPLTSVSAIVFYVPITFKNGLRFEPSIGMFSTSSSTTTTFTNSGTESSNTNSTDASVTTLGIRLTYSSPVSNSFSLYFGPRLEFGLLSSTDEYSYYTITSTSPNYTPNDNKTTTHETDVTVGAILGAEYFPIRRFSIGGEVAFSYITFGSPDVINEEYPPQTSSGVTTSSRDQHTLFTNSRFFLRWYFL
jgi:Outer membrane protein beta-barrel domain